ncbi:MAG: methylenetetrahydrofolate--tRNA-(uracil(54)-C(5))-methyltransferase (FADH(2)-oxidizing) TrmFO [Myxococcales bacterium]|nr:methylenetetrahydrofolate--tRNA-(uracil(54)-C(5))-methyltransferase (FADH(2)-oxidizing) TrmFO [Myxococcales bacterium]MCB9708982.1 methylenetetrahydrofolate--tRNA-(uracil(54)-C(5))-methyltransferase (FADH(2)-oxidizing) TrmFO [Myxococcales bacterium]
MHVTVVGAGLAGCECAWQLARRHIDVTIVEQKPSKRTPAQQSDRFAELVCSNSFRGEALSNAVGLLKEEMRRMGSLIMMCADQTRVPAGGALAVDRERFSSEVTRRIESHPRISVMHTEAAFIPEDRPAVIATGPLTADALAQDLERRLGSARLAYYDAIAPVVLADSIDWDKVFRASRYDKGGDDAYVNCPMDRDQYTAFIKGVEASAKVSAHAFEDAKYFEGCLPIEVMVARGELTLAYGPMKPVGLIDPHTGRRPYAVVQLRQEDHAATAYNLVGFQTRLTYAEQKQVFRMIPGLEQAEFERLGSVHRNTFVDAPEVLDADLSVRAMPDVYLAGQITGVEGYVESAACGLIIGTVLALKHHHRAPVLPPKTTALGALVTHLQSSRSPYQPSNVVWSLFPPLDDAPRLKKRARHEALAARALKTLTPYVTEVSVDGAGVGGMPKMAVYS